MTKIEKETVILFNEEEAEAEIYTHNQELKERLASAADQYPNLYKLKETDPYGGVGYAFPKEHLSGLFAPKNALCALQSEKASK